MKRKNLKKPMISALEQRILFDGAAVATAVDVLDESNFSKASKDAVSQNDVTKNNAENSVHEAQAVQGFERNKREVAFVDVTVKDYQTLVDGIGEGVETYLVSSMNDIKSILSNEANIDAIHILSHGNIGEITVGNDILNKSTLNNFDEVLQSMKNSLSEDGDILLYGCNVANDGSGQDFISEFSNLTLADVAASDDTTGSSNLGGDWDLEYKVGNIESENLVIENYNYSLANDKPYILGKETATVNEDGSITINGFSVSDANTTDTLTVKIVSQNGTLNLTTTIGVTVSGTDTNTLEITGSNQIQLNTALNTLRYTPNANYSGSDALTITVNDGSGEQGYRISQEGKFFNTQNGHYYEFVNASGITWENAKNAAALKTLYGLKGYLVTITSAYENQLVSSKANGNGWIGASDAASEGVWKWVTGPEAGTQFWQGAGNGYVVGGNYNNWASGEPNDSGGNEDYAHFYGTNGDTNYTKWNDFAGNNSNITGYIVEYGGLAGDSLQTANLTITITAVNDAPTIEATNTVSYMENANGVVLSPNITLGDVDNATLASATVSISTGFVSGDRLNFTNNSSTYGNITGSYVSGVLTLSSSGKTATLEQWQNALRSVSYDSTNEALSLTEQTRTVSWIVNDGALSSTVSTSTINVTGVNDAPTISNSANTINYTENANAIVLSPNININDVDNTTLASATVSISTGFVSGDRLNFTNNPATMGNITASYDSSTGVLTLSSAGQTATIAEWRNALRSVSYDSTSEVLSLTQTSRTVSWAVNDGALSSTVSTSTINVTGVNDAPTISNSANTINYTENANAIVLSPNITLNDIDNTTLASTTVSISTGFVSGDRLNFTNDSSTMGNISASYNNTTGVLTLSSAGQTATIAEWQNALRSISYDSTSEALSLTEQTRTVSWSVNDGLSNSAVATSTIKVLGVNDAPTLSVSDLKNNFTETTDANNQNLLKSGTISFNDVDNNVTISSTPSSVVYSGGTLDSAVATALINGFSINTTNNVQSSNGTWTYSVNNIDLNFLAQDETITFSYTIVVTDTQGATDTKTVSFKIIGTNDAPTFGAQDPANANPINSTTKQIFDNAGFENGLTGWTTNGNASVVDKATVTFSTSSSMQMTPEVKAILGNSNQMTWVVDSHGTGMVKLEANGASNEFNTNFQSDLNVSSDTVKYIKDTFYATSNKVPTNMAYISKTFYAEAGTTYSIAWNYISGDYVPWNDGSVLTFANNTNPSSTAVLDGVKAEVILLGATNPGTGNYTTSSYGSTGWQTTTIQVLESGSYTLGLSVFNLGDTSLNPYLFVDNLVGTTTLNNQVFAPLQQDTNAPIPAGESFIIETGLTETNSGLSSSGTMSIEDKDLKDSVTVSVKSVSVDLRDSSNNLISNSLSQTTNEQLLSMLSLDSTLIIESGSTKGSFKWYFNSGNEAFNYLKAGEVLKLTYTFQADDGNGGVTDQSVDIVITGTNDAVVVNPLIPIEIINTSNSSESFSTVTGAIDATDLDNDNLTYNILNSSNNPVQELVGVYGVLKLNSTTGQYEYIPNNTKINTLTSSVTESFKIKVSDSSTSSTQNLTVKIDYVNAMPLVGGDKSEVTFVENSKPIIIDSNITIVDPEYADFGGGYLRVDYLQGKESSDNLTILEVGGITLDRGDVFYSGVKIGTIDTLQNGENGKSLKINLNDKAYSHQVQALAQSIAFVNSTDDLSDTSRVIEFRVNDGGDSDNSIRFSSKEALVNIQTINDLPQISFNNSSYVVEKIINVNEDGTLVLDKISFADLDGDTLTVVLETTNYGTLTIDEVVANGLIASQIVGNGTNSVTLTGTIEQINKTLASVNGIVYSAGVGKDFITPGADFIKVTATDEFAGTSVSSKMVVVLPAIPNADSKNIVDKEDNPVSVDLDSLVVDINDNNGFFTFGTGSADISDVNGNITTTGNISSFDVTNIIYDENSKAIGYQLTNGKLILSDINSSLEGDFTSKDGQFIFIPNENWYGSETFVYQYTSGDGDTSLIAQINVFVLPVNDKPVISVTTSDINIDEDTPYTFDNSNLIVISDIDNVPTQDLELKIEVIEGRVNLADLSNVTILEGENGSSKIVLRGTLDNLQEAIKNLVYTPKDNYFGDDYLTIILDDLGGSGEGGNKLSTQTINFTINSVNDIPQIEVVDVTGSIIDGSKLNDKGSIKFTDADITDRPTAVENTKSIIGKAQDGTNLSLTQKQISDIENAFSIMNLPTNVNNGTITWDYTISQDKIDFLGEDETVTAIFTITVTDDEGVEVTQDVTVTITGTNDAPTIQIVDVSGIITDGIKLSDNGSITFVDLDLTDRPVATEVTKSVNAVGQDGITPLVLTEQQRSDIENAFSIVNVDTNVNNGTITWDYTISQDKIDFLGKDEVVTAVFTISVTDDEGAIATQDVIVTITGSNDSPAIQIVDVNANIVEGSVLNDTGSITFTDLDLTDRAVATEATKSVTAVSQDGVTPLVLTSIQQQDIEAAFTINNVNTNTNDGTVTWDYSISEDKINFLGKGEVVTAVFTISVTDDEGANATQDVTVTITGTNDAPTVSFENIDFEIPFGEVYNKDISSLFSDKDLTDKFKFEATNLPLGLTIDSNTGIISGRVAQSGNFVIVIKGIDSAGASVTRTYNMLVIAPAQIAEPTKPSSPSIPTNNDTTTNNSTDGLNNFADNSSSNLGVLNFNSNDGLSLDTGIGFLDTSNNSSANNAELNSSTNQNGEIDGSNNNSSTNNTSNTNDSRGVLQANIDLNVLTNGQIVFNEANQDSFSIVGITIEDIKIENNSIEIKVVDTNLSQNFIVTQIDGTALPAGLFFDPRTGNISGTIPEDLEKLEISIKAINQDGTTRVLNLKLDLKELKKAQKNQVDADEKYMGLKEQIALENQKLDDYGSYLTRLFA